jgi:hypothetical protein
MLRFLKKKPELPTVYFLNDTRRVHAGCHAVVRSLCQALRDTNIIHFHKVGSQKLSKRHFDQADIIFANGEGTIHHRSDHGRFILETLRMAQSLGKRTFLVNSLFQEELPYFSDVFENLDFLSVREPESERLAIENGGRPHLFVDSSVWVRNLPGRAKLKLDDVIKGKIHWQCAHNQALDFLPLRRAIVPKYYHLCNYEDFIASLTKCRVYVTGEHHGVFAAGLAGIPFVPIASNSFKIESVLEWANVDIPLCRTEDEIADSIAKVEQRRAEFDKFHSFVISAPFLQHDDIKEHLFSDERSE